MHNNVQPAQQNSDVVGEKGQEKVQPTETMETAGNDNLMDETQEQPELMTGQMTSISTSPGPNSTSPAPISTSPTPIPTSPTSIPTSPTPILTSPTPILTSPSPIPTSPALLISPSSPASPLSLGDSTTAIITAETSTPTNVENDKETDISATTITEPPMEETNLPGEITESLETPIVPETETETEVPSVTEENTILLPEPDKQLVEEISVAAADGDLEDETVTDEQTIAIKTENNVAQEDVLAEPLGEEDNMYVPNIDVPPISGLLKVEAYSPDNEGDTDDKSGRRRTTRKSAVAAAAAIRVRSEPSPETELELIRTRSSNKKRLMSSSSADENNDDSLRDKKKSKQIKVEKDSDEEENDSNDVIPIDINCCRICLSKDSLISIFAIEDSYTVAHKVIYICKQVKISQTDQLPQFICNNCLQSVNVAFNLKVLCEKTDKELRSKLKKNKMKKERLIIKYEPIIFEAEDEGVEDAQDKDDDFVISNESEHSAIGSDSESDFGSKRKRATQRRKPSGSKKRSSSSSKRNRSSKARKRGVENGNVEQNDVSSDEEAGPSKRKRPKLRSSRTDDDENNKRRELREHICIYCEEKFNTRKALREHKKMHAGQKPFSCTVCNKSFKLIGSYKAHLEKHKEEDNPMCNQCNTNFQNKTELKKHMVDEHNEPQTLYSCDICKRAFATPSRLKRHKLTKCANPQTSSSKKEKKKNSEHDGVTGKDLFKCVAPMTTTYWSDSFSD